MSDKSDQKKHNRETAESAFQIESAVRGIALFESIRTVARSVHHELSGVSPAAREVPVDTFCMALAALVCGQDPESGPDLVRGLSSVAGALTNDHPHASIGAFYELASAARVLAARITPQGVALRNMVDNGTLFDDLRAHVQAETATVLAELRSPPDSAGGGD